jgi:hypothetical protein
MKKQIFILVFFSTISFGQTNSELSDTTDFSYGLNLIDTTFGKKIVDSLIVSNVKYYYGEILLENDSLKCKTKIIFDYSENLLAIENPKTYKLEFINLYLDYETLSDDNLTRVYQGGMNKFYYFQYKIDKKIGKKNLQSLIELEHIGALNEYEFLSLATFYE